MGYTRYLKFIGMILWGYDKKETKDMNTAPPNITDEFKAKEPPINSLAEAQKPAIEFQNNLPADFFPNISAPKGVDDPGAISLKDLMAESQKLTNQRVANVAAQNKENFRGLLADFIREQAGKNVGTLDESGVSKKTLDDFLQRQSERQELHSKDILLQSNQSLLDKIFTSQQQQAQFSQEKTMADAQFSQEKDITGARFAQEKTMTDAQFSQEKDMKDLVFKQEKLLADISVENKQKLLTFQQELANGINPDTKVAYTDIEVKNKLSEFNLGIDKDLATFKLNAERGINPDTKVAYTDTELADIAVDRQLAIAEKENALLLKYNTSLAGLKNGVDEKGNPLTEVEAQAKINQLQSDFQKDLATFKLNAERGINPNTKVAYTDTELADIAVDRQLAIAEKENALLLKYNTSLAGLKNGVDEKGNPLTEVEAQAKINQLQIDFQADVDRKAFEASLIAEYGANGVQIAKDLAETRGDNAKAEISFLTGVSSDDTMSPSTKNSIIDLVDAGVPFDDAQIITHIPSNSETFKNNYIKNKNTNDLVEIILSLTTDFDVSEHRDISDAVTLESLVFGGIFKGDKATYTLKFKNEMTTAIEKILGPQTSFSFSSGRKEGQDGVDNAMNRENKMREGFTKILNENQNLLNNPDILSALKKAMIEKKEEV